MSNKQQVNGMRGVFLVAAELARLGLVVSLTSRSAKGVDLLATNEDCKKVFSIEVKFVTSNSFWQLSKHANTLGGPNHYFVFVRAQRATKRRPKEIIDYYPVPCASVKELLQRPAPGRPATDQYRDGYTITRDKITAYENIWNCFSA